MKSERERNVRRYQYVYIENMIAFVGIICEIDILNWRLAVTKTNNKNFWINFEARFRKRFGHGETEIYWNLMDLKKLL